ncbi:MAG: helix-turn-helix domain-containing protein [Desulfovibrio sp.]
MSVDAMQWAWKQNLRPLCKLVLLSLADRADERHRCFPSAARLVEDTGANKKTVYAALSELREAGLIRETGERTGRTKQVRIYALVGVCGREKQTQKRNTTKNGTVPETELTQIGASLKSFLGNGVEIDNVIGELQKMKQTQKWNSTENGTLPETEQYQKRKCTVSGPESDPKTDLKVTQKRVTESPKESPKEPKDSLARTCVRTGAREGILTPDFEFLEFENLYPKKIGMEKALVEWVRLKSEKKLPPYLEVLDALKGWTECEQWQEHNGRFIPYPANWLGNEMWREVPEAAAVTDTSRFYED